MNSRPLGADRGASAVELAIVLPVLLLVLGGIIDFGRAFTTQMAVTQAAREGARMVALNYSAGDVNSRVNAAAGTFAVTTTIVAGCPARGPRSPPKRPRCESTIALVSSFSTV